MAGSPEIILGTFAFGSGSTATASKPSGLVDGDVIGILIRTQGVVPDAGFTRPAGFERAGSDQNGDRGQGIFYKPIPDAEAETATSYAFSGYGSTRWIIQPFIVRGGDLADLIGGSDAYRSGSTPTLATGAYNGGDPPFVAIALWGDERVAGNSHIPSSKPAGWTELVNKQTGDNTSTSGSRTAMFAAILEVEEGGSATVPAASLTWGTSVADICSVSATFRGTIEEVPSNPVGVEVKDGEGNPAFISYLNGAGERVAPAFVRQWLPGFDAVADLLATPGATMAHRGGSLVWPEMSEYAYDHSVTAGYGALEFSCGWTSDLIPFGLGDQYLDRVSGVTGNVDPTTLNWTSLLTTYRNVLRPVTSGVTQPYFKLEDFLIKYSPTHVLLVDPKYGFSDATKVAEMLDLCDAHGGPERIIIKFDSPTANTVMTNAAHARGYLCMNYWGDSSNSAAMDSQQGNWDLIGALYSDTTMLAQAGTYGKPVWGAVIPSLSGYNTAIAAGADIAMCTHPINIPAVSVWNTEPVVPPHPNLQAEYGFSEGSGTTSVDSSGHDRTITLNNTIWEAAGKTGFGLRKSDATINSGARVVGFTTPAAAVTVMGWAKPLDLTAGTTRPAFGFVDNSGNSQAILYFQRGDFGTQNVVQGNIRIGGSLRSLAGSALTVDTWVHLALTYDGAVARLVINGVTVSSGNYTGTVTPGDFFCALDSLNSYFPNGVVDDIRVFDVGLTDSEITTFMNTPVD